MKNLSISILIRKVRFMEYILRALWGATGVRNWIVAGIIYYYYDDIYCAIKLAAECFLYVRIYIQFTVYGYALGNSLLLSFIRQ